MKKKKGGFTLVELIVVIVIILILAAVLVPSLLKYVSKAKKAAAISECKEVVQAAQRVATDLAEEDVLTSVTLNDKRPTILKEADAGGSFETEIQFEDDTSEIVSFEYLSKSGLHVIFDIKHKPQVYIEEEDPTLTKINNCIKTASDYVIEWNAKKKKGEIDTGWDREELTKNAVKNGGLLQVTDSQLKGASKKYTSPLYWHPYNLGSTDVESPPIALFANTSATDRGGWSAQLVYVDGKIYEGNKNIASWRTINDFESLETWLGENNFHQIN